LTGLSKRGYAAAQIDFTFNDFDINQNVIRSQLLLGLILPLSLIAVGLIRMGKSTGLTAM